MTTLRIYRGLQGSGKTTLAQMWVAEDVRNRARINRDDLRAMMHEDVFIKGHTEPQIITVQHAAIATLLERGISVVCDDTNLDARTVRQLLALAANAQAQVEIIDLTDIPLQVCIERDRRRYDGAHPSSCVGEEVITGAYNRFVKGQGYPLPVPELNGGASFTPDPYSGTPGKPPAVIFDMDGTLAIIDGRSPYDEDWVGKDLPNQAVLDILFAHAAFDCTVLITSGRTEYCREETITWLRKYGVGPDVFRRDHLFMRAEGDTRKDAVVKHELFWEHIAPHFDVRCVYDDRDQVVKLWRDMGITCCQVGYGAF